LFGSGKGVPKDRFRHDACSHVPAQDRRKNTLRIELDIVTKRNRKFTGGLMREFPAVRGNC
jgi:hypothetical protein